MQAIVCRSPVEIAEDYLVFACKQVFNVSREEAVRCQVQMREIGGAVRREAEQLLLTWEGTYFQQTEAYRLYNAKVSCISNCRF